MRKRIFLLPIFILTISLLYCHITLAESSKNYLKGKFYSSVKNHFLVASKKMKDERFKKTVIAMLENDENGAWGFVINKPLGSTPLALLLDPSKNTSEEREKLYKIEVPIFWGGPVDTNKVFVLHSQEYMSETTKKFGIISISKGYKILADIAKNKGPKEKLIILGYSGWGDGQLEGEMERDDWVLSNFDFDIIFKKKPNEKWKLALNNSFIKI
tara:strand:- start:1144 stop:1785 length:642 start_codon:yes stop_codon:yes gene_type:complete